MNAGDRRHRSARRPGRRAAAAATCLLALLAPRAEAPAQDHDPWLGRDKALHFSGSAVLASGGYGAAAALTDSRPARLGAGAALALSAGVAKELVDLSGPGDASWRDLAWDVLGTVTGLAIAWTIDRLLSGPPRGAPVPAAAAP